MRRWSLTLMLSFVSVTSLFAQAKYLQSGPMVGYSEMSEVLLWVQTNAPAKVAFRYWLRDQRDVIQHTAAVRTQENTAYTAKLLADRVEPGQSYEYQLLIKDKHVERPIYDLTVSPLTADANPRAASEATQLRVADTFVGEHNFALLAISGQRQERTLKISVF